jgi:hypothetical protein
MVACSALAQRLSPSFGHVFDREVGHGGSKVNASILEPLWRQYESFESDGYFL